jgi:hypothetical protein
VAEVRAYAASAQADAKFPPLQVWRAAVLSGDASGLTALYSANPPATAASPENKNANASLDVQFWTALKADGLSAIELSEIQDQSPQSDLRQIIFQATLILRDRPARRRYVSVAQVWQKQGETWRIVSSKRTAAARLRQPLSPKKDLYPAGEDAQASIKEALDRAAANHKRVLLVFGGNWCYDCHVLDAAFHSAEIAPLIAKSFEVVHVDVGEYNKNLDLAERYDVPLKKGVPAIAVVASDGKLLFSQKAGEFEAARRMGPEDIVAFLERWKP